MKRAQLGADIGKSGLVKVVAEKRTCKRISPDRPLVIIELEPIFQIGRAIGLEEVCLIEHFRAVNNSARFEVGFHPL